MNVINSSICAIVLGVSIGITGEQNGGLVQLLFWVSALGLFLNVVSSHEFKKLTSDCGEMDEDDDEEDDF